MSVLETIYNGCKLEVACYAYLESPGKKLLVLLNYGSMAPLKVKMN